MGPDGESHELSRGSGRIQSGWGKIAQQSRAALSRDRQEGWVGGGRKGNNDVLTLDQEAPRCSIRLMLLFHETSHTQQRMNSQ